MRALRALMLTGLFALLPALGAAQLLPPPAASRADVSTPASLPGKPAAKAGAQRVGTVEVELVADVARAAPGEPFRLALRLEHDPHWHTYWRNPGDSGLPTRFDPAGPAGASYGEIVWPAPRRLAIGPLANYGYEGEVLLARQVSLAGDASAARFEVHAQWLVCKDVCIPGEARLALDLPVGRSVEPAGTALLKKFDESVRRAPDTRMRLEAGWWQQGERAFLVMPAGTHAGRAEFFPYFEGRIRPAAPQLLVESSVAGSAGRPTGSAGTSGTAAAPLEVLALKLETMPAAAPQVSAQEAGAPRQDPGGLPQPPAGLLLLDGRPVEVGLRLMSEEPAPGRLLSTAEVVPAAPPAPGGLLKRLRASTSAFSNPSGTSPSSAASVARAFPSSALSGASSTLPLALVAALLGGLILNLLPCVFPVIGLKVLSFSQAAAGEAGLARRHALSFGAGVVLSFVALGAVLLGLRSAGEAAGWGFQMQSPLFVGAMALLFVLIGLNLFGVFETGLSLTRLTLPGRGLQTDRMTAAGAAAAPGLGNSFGTGVIAVLVATPCTAPFMGSAVGYTISSPPLQTLAVFAALGFGMAAPYLLLGSAPGLLRWLPKPGPWLQDFKQFLAFPMLATAAWLAWVLTLQAGADGLLRLLTSAILVAFVAWLYGRAQAAWFSGRSGPGWLGLAVAVLAGFATVWQLAQIGSSTSMTAQPASVTAATATAAATQGSAGGEWTGATRSAGEAGATGATGAAGAASEADGGVAVDSSALSGWQAWSAQKVSQALAQGRPVVVEFTAAWCISCQATKKLVLDRQVVREAFAADRVALLRADWTSRDPVITAELARFGRNGVPLYLVYHPKQSLPLMLPELLTVDILLAALADGR
ncbi:MAG: thioredoxin family protein [Lautropia sp.]|nr:thioredoxin family protein [Lautropia sp.]